MPPESPRPGASAGEVCIDTIAIRRTPPLMLPLYCAKDWEEGTAVARKRTIVITGASSGIGAIAARELSSEGWDVAVVGRNPQRTESVAKEVGGTPFIADYDRLDDVRALGDDLIAQYPTIDVLANNAGGLVSRRGVTAEGNERTFQHNLLAPFLLTNLLVDRLTESRGRVLNTASSANSMGHINLANLNSKGTPYLGGWRAYGTSKLETIAITRELARRTSLTAYSFHPGFVATSFGTDSAGGRFLMRLASPAQISADAGAAPLIELAARADIDVPNGTYFDGLKPNGFERRQASDPAIAAGLWDACARLAGLT